MTWMIWCPMQNNRRCDRRNLRQSPCPFDYAQLETKLPLAGNVAVSLQGDHLTITGDDLGNFVVVTRDAQGTTTVRGDSTSINGSAQAFVTTASVRHLTVQLNGGDDQLVMEGVQIGRNLIIEGGDGNDSLRLQGVSARELYLNSGSGADTVQVENTTIGRTATLLSPTGESVIAVSGMRTGRHCVITSGGPSSISLESLHVNRDLHLRSGDSQDQIVMVGANTVNRKSKINLGGGDDFFGILPQRMNEQATLGRRLTVDAGIGDDLVVIDQNVALRRSAKLGGNAGNDTVRDLTNSAGRNRHFGFEAEATGQPNREFRTLMNQLQARGVDAKKFGAVFLEVAPATQSVTFNNPRPTISVRWDDVAQAAVAAKRSGPTVASRVYAMVHTAMYDAWSAYDLTARSTLAADEFQRPIAENTDANKAEAMSYAAYGVLSDLYPDQVAKFDELMQALGYDRNNRTLDVTTPAGIGNTMASRLLEFRHKDGANQLGDSPTGTAGVPYSDTTGYTPKNSVDAPVNPQFWTPERVPIDAVPGSEVRTQKYLTPHWGKVTPFGLERGDQFRPSQGPPNFLLVEGATLNLAEKKITLADATVLDIDRSLVGTVINPEFIAIFDEVVRVGADLTDQQKIIAEFWEDGPDTSFPPGSWMTFGQFVSARDNHSLDDDAKMFFALGNAVFDAGIATWDTKLAYDYARPVRTIRTLGELGLIGEFDAALGGYAIDGWVPNQGTKRILAKNWLTYQTPGGDPSPPFPDYTSGHSAYSASAAEVLKRFTGSDEFGGSITIAVGKSRFEPNVTPASPITLSWPTFSAAAEQAGISRVYGGIHFQKANVDGAVIGRAAGTAAWNRAQRLINGQA